VVDVEEDEAIEVRALEEEELRRIASSPGPRAPSPAD
jgi:hypothetical protein